MDTYKDTLLLNELWDRGARPGGRWWRHERALSRWKGVPVLVTGAQGFIGSWLAERLLDEGANGGRAAARRRARHRFTTDGIAERCVHVQRRPGRLRVAARASSTSTTCARSSTWRRRRSSAPPTARRSRPSRPTSAAPTRCWKPAARRRRREPVERIVVASSDKAYGEHEELPYREDFPLAAALPVRRLEGRHRHDRAPYARPTTCRWRSRGWRTSTAAATSTQSASSRTRSRALLRGKPPVIRSDGSPERDYLYVEDAVDAYLAIADSLDDRRAVGAGVERGHRRAGGGARGGRAPDRSVSASDVEPDIQGEGTPHGEIDRQFLDSTAIRERARLGAGAGSWTAGWPLPGTW